MTRIAHVARMGAAISMACTSALFATDDRLAYAFVRDGLYYYDVGSYVQDGLLAHFDGLRNAGANADHNGSATTWVNLGPSGGNASFVKAGDSTGHWTADGYFFHHAYAKIANKIAPGSEFTVQWVGDIDTSVQTTSFPNYFAGSDDWCVFTRGAGSELEWKTAAPQIFNSRPKYRGWSGKTFSAIATSTNCYITQEALYEKTQPRSTQESTGEKTWTIGGSAGGAADRYTLGVTHAVRLYGRALTEAELLQNLTVDDFRFRHPGALPVTNVCVASEIPELPGTEANGPYAVADAHAFTVPVSRTWNGNVYTNAGYSVEVWRDASGTWGEATFHAGQSYTYTLGDSPAKVRLTWLWAMSSGERRWDADEYARHGLVLHLDGIRNAGLGQPHSETTNVWANLADPGNPAPITQLAGSTNYWCGQGFFFGDAAYARIQKNIDIGFQCTLQAATDFDNFEQRRILGDEYRWPTVVGSGADNCIFYTQQTSSTMVFRMNDIIGKWTSFNWSGKYVTALWDYDRQGASQDVVPAFTTQGELIKPLGPQRWSVGSSTIGLNARYMVGEVFAVRLYDRLLSARELALNRELDEVRFRGAIPLSDTVFVDSNHRTLGGDDPKGPYTFVGGVARTFAASVTNATLNGKTLALVGYTLETWNPETRTWGDPVPHGGTTYVYAAGTDRANVRLTWQWKVTRGLKSSYDVDDYARGGLLAFYDGVRNAGAEADHDAAAKSWADLSGNGRHAYFRSAEADGMGCFASSGAWCADGYAFAGDSYATMAAALHVGRRFTTQFVSDLVFGEQTATWPTFIGTTKDCGNQYTGGKSATLSLKTDYINGTAYNSGRSVLGGWSGKGATAFVDYDRTCLFATGTIGTWCQGTFKNEMTDNRWAIGSVPDKGGAERYLIGTMHAVRIYDRILSAEEVARNYAVDQNRFRGAGLATTNVVVASARADAQGVEPNGVYEVDGEWTFTAQDMKDEGGRTTFAVDGYTVETWSNGAWGAPARQDGTNYTYAAAAGAAPVRLTWLWRNTSGAMVIVR